MLTTTHKSASAECRNFHYIEPRCASKAARFTNFSGGKTVENYFEKQSFIVKVFESQFTNGTNVLLRFLMEKLAHSF